MDVPRWVQNELNGVRLGDGRRNKRMRSLVAGLWRRPAGRVSDAFPRAADRQAAYDFLEHEAVSTEKVVEAGGLCGAELCRDHDEVLVAVDGSSLTVTDDDEAKDFGNLGTHARSSRGLKVITALALTGRGQPLGPLHQEWWARTRKSPGSSKFRPPEQRESWRWTEAVRAAGERVAKVAPGTRMHILADREADASVFMQGLVGAGHDFTIRANGTRKVLLNGRPTEVRRAVERQRPIGRLVVDLRARRGRRRRTATLVIRRLKLPVNMCDRLQHRSEQMQLHVVLATETGHRGKRLDWLLYTTQPVVTDLDAIAAVRRYTYRWRIEEFHRAWKRGGCCVEDTQLRSANAVIKWATIHALVAARAERLKHLSRSTPTAPASSEFTAAELRALIALKTSEKKRTEHIPTDQAPTLAQAVRWVADLGGYVGSKSSGPPGTTVISRGLSRVIDAAQVIQTLIATGQLR